MNDDDFAELFKKLPSQSSGGATWQDVGTEFEALGRTVGEFLRGAWKRQENDPLVGKLRESLQSMVQGLSQTVDGTPEAQQARDQLVHLTDVVRDAAERASDELRPELLKVLRQANAELRRITPSGD